MDRRITACLVFVISMLLTLIFAQTSWAISWSTDLNAALKEAKGNKKPIMADFYTTWCHWCKELDRNTYTDGKVVSLSEYFICVKVDAEKERSLVSKYSIRGYPTIVFLNSDGSVNDRITGYKDAAAFASIMESILKRVKSPQYKISQEKAARAEAKASDKKDAAAEKFDKEEFERNLKKEMDKVKNRNLELSGIIFNRQKVLVAIINNTFVKEGDLIGEGKVVKVTKDRAEVAFQDGTVVLKMD